jgi:hypothetical protein
MPAGSFPIAVQQEDRLRAKLGADATPTDADGESIHRHENFERKSIHKSLIYLPKQLALFNRAIRTQAECRPGGIH